MDLKETASFFGCMYLCVVYGLCHITCEMVREQLNVQELILFFYHVWTRDEIQIVRLDSKYLYRLSHLTSQRLVILNFSLPPGWGLIFSLDYTWIALIFPRPCFS